MPRPAAGAGGGRRRRVRPLPCAAPDPSPGRSRVVCPSRASTCSTSPPGGPVPSASGLLRRPRGRGRPRRVHPPHRRHAHRWRHVLRPRPVVGVQRLLPVRPTPTSTTSPSTLDTPKGRELALELVEEGRHRHRELHSPGDRGVRPRLARRPRGQPARHPRPHAGVRPRRALAGPARLRPDHGADHRPGLGRPATPTTSPASSGARATPTAGCTPCSPRSSPSSAATAPARAAWSRPRCSRPRSTSAAEPAIEWSAYGVARRAHGQPQPGRRTAEPLRHRRAPSGGSPSSCATDDQWRALAASSADPTSPTSPSWPPWPGRRAAADRLDRLIAAWAGRATRSTRPSTSCSPPGCRPLAAPTPAGPRDNEQMAARGYFEPVEHPVVGTHPPPACPSATPASTTGSAGRRPTLGQHNAEILGGWLGHSRRRARRPRGRGRHRNLAPRGLTSGDAMTLTADAPTTGDLFDRHRVDRRRHAPHRAARHLDPQLPGSRSTTRCPTSSASTAATRGWSAATASVRPASTRWPATTGSCRRRSPRPTTTSPRPCTTPRPASSSSTVRASTPRCSTRTWAASATATSSASATASSSPSACGPTTTSSPTGARPTAARLIPITALPFWDLDLALAEMERCIEMGTGPINFCNQPQDYGMPPLAHTHWDPDLGPWPRTPASP